MMLGVENEEVATKQYLSSSIHSSYIVIVRTNGVEITPFIIESTKFFMI